MKIDKWKHLGITFALCSVLIPLATVFFGAIGVLYATGVIFALIFGKEAYDKVKGGAIDRWDIAIALLAWFTYTVFFLIHLDNL